ncbi:hypothetical protein U1Q18_029412 [Sarracenia purpurea var. burkii]
MEGDSVLCSPLRERAIHMETNLEMAMETTDSSPAHSAQLVGNSFVEQYYKVLLSKPDIAYNFYQDSSVLSRPGPDGVMTSVTTVEGIKDKILSLDYKDHKAEITTVDAQDSYKEGVIVLVTGRLSGKDNVERSFTQTFFLARHAKRYYVLNDVFRFVDVPEPITPSTVIDGNENIATPPLSPKSPNEDTKSSIDSNGTVVKEVVVNELPLSPSSNGENRVVKSASNGQENPQKMSYASILAKVSLVVTSPIQVSNYTSSHQPKQASSAPKPSARRSNNPVQNSNTSTDGKSIYIGNLPSDVSVEQLDAIFKKFGPIKNGGIQIRNYEDGFCYGFVEFESSDSARSAIEAHKITVGSKEAYITEKRSPNQASNGRGKFPQGKGEVRNGNYRNRENFVEGRGYGPNQHGNRDEFSGHTRGPVESNGEGNRRVYRDGGRRNARSGGMN